jgi:PBP1b-binding outer membrane lipoprotein LpoB
MNSLKIKTKTLVLMLSTCALLLQGCSSPTASTSLAKATPVGQITVVHALPKAIPSEGSSFAGSQYIFV